MDLGGQGSSHGRLGGADRGYAMAALLVGMSIMAVLMGAALPVWNKQAQREREEEYLFRAHEYARAVMKFRQRIANTNPPSVDVLVEQRFLRRKYKDPITGEDFQLVYQTAGAGIQPGSGTATPGQMTPPGGGLPSSGPGGTATAGAGGTPTAGTGAPVPGAGIIGVVSKSKASSIKVYNGRTRYDQWAVTYQDVRPGKGLPPDLLQAINATAAAAGGAGPGAGGGPANPFGSGAAPPGPGTTPFGAPGGPSPFGGATGPSPFGTPAQPSPFGGGGFGQPVPPPPGGAPGGSPFSPAYPAPPTGGSGGTLFGPPPKKG
ncbi:MAG: type II secretion system protein [Vicinamibacterales bacterium]